MQHILDYLAAAVTWLWDTAWWWLVVPLAFAFALAVILSGRRR